ncbi:hypothetical protein BD310DRAFT_923671 [Dichomitus squalens]|uniref:Uncharacterized protein n=1 Tax=Dichomitus squalens TaxID=114155 RepID=A0A4V2K8H5_9APHY|nr:hypothetical protein BD310DRAFT_923671 [Dichomitus squalens]
MSGGMRWHVRLQSVEAGRPNGRTRGLSLKCRCGQSGLATQSMACHSASPALNPRLQNPHLSTPLSHLFSITRYDMPILQHAPWALIL